MSPRSLDAQGQSSIGVLNGIEKICREAGIDPTDINFVMHGTTVATNTVLTGSGALVGLVTTKGYRDTLQIARSYVPGGLGGWVIWNKSLPLAPLELTRSRPTSASTPTARCWSRWTRPRCATTARNCATAASRR
jgi:hypothetical protein